VDGAGTHVVLMLDVVGDRRGSAGNARLLLELATGLQELGHRITLVCHEFDPAGNFDRLGDHFDVRAVNTGSRPRPRGKRAILQRYWSGMRRMANLVPVDADVINAHDWPALRAGALAARRLDVPLVWTRNDDTGWERALIPASTSRGTTRPLPRLTRGAIGLLDLRDARRADAIVVLSDFDAAMVRTAYRRHAEVIRIGCAERFFARTDRDSARRRLGIGPGEFLVLAVALLMAHRRFEDLIDAVATIPAQESVRCLIVGSDHIAPGYADALAAQITSLGVGDRVELRRDAVTDLQLRELYAAADSYVFPSSRQSYGQAPLEALASGTPVIVSTGAGVCEVLQGRPGVEIVPPGRAMAIAAAILGQKVMPRDRVEPTRSWLREELTNARYAGAMAAVIARSTVRRT
jgi:glycosyltransferase involved in cell wall biosynthesis